MGSSAGNQAGVLDDERAVLNDLIETLQAVRDAQPGDYSREEMAEVAVGLSRGSERLAMVAGRYLAVGETNACSYTKGQSTMIGLVNAQGRMSRARAASLRRAGTALYRFPHFHRALLAGSITLAHVDLMTRWAKKADSGQVAHAEEALAAFAVLTTPEEFELGLRQWVAVANPNEHLDEFIRAQARRHLVLQKDLFDNVHVSGVLEPLFGEQLAEAVRANAQRLMADDADLGIHTAQHDALVQLVLDPNGDGVKLPGIDILSPPHDPDDLAGNDPDPTSDDNTPTGGIVFGNDLGTDAFCYMLGRAHRAKKTPVAHDRSFGSVCYPHTVGGTLVPPAMIAELVRRGARVRRHRLDLDGDLVNDHVTGAEFTAKQKRLIRLRDQHCQQPGCLRPASACDADHVVPRHRGGPTAVSNGQLLCRFHHRWKHRNDHDPGPSSALLRLFANSPVTPQLE